MNYSKIRENLVKKIGSLDLSFIKEETFDKLSEIEQELFNIFQELYVDCLSSILQELLNKKQVKKTLRDQANGLGLGRRKYKRLVIQIGTGEEIVLISSYFERNYLVSTSSCRGHKIGGHLILYNWSCIAKSSPRYYSFCGMLSVMCPSFDIALQVLHHIGIKGSYNKIRKLSLLLGRYKSKLGVNASLEKGETLSGKRVLVSYDGGRSRIREETGALNKAGNKTFDTPWCEPHVFVIHVLNKQGELEKTHQPYYGVQIGTNEQAIQELLSTLVTLEVDKAEEVQFVADGARCIWKELKRKLIDIGVANKKITLTLDYYHAVEHLYEIIKVVEKNENKVSKLAKELKNNPDNYREWHGSIQNLIQQLKQEAEVKKLFQKAKQEEIDIFKREINYFKKHFDRMQYAKFRRKKLVCASGIVESAIRRIINLRFKSASSFWKKENLEPLMFLRATFLAKRWYIFFDNLRTHIKHKVITISNFA